MSAGLTSVAYIGASILFILSLGGLSHQETARRGNIYGIVGMAIAIAATIAATQIDDYTILGLAVIVGAAIGIFVASRVEMTQMPQLVAILHSFVGLAAVLVGVASYVDPNSAYQGVEKTIHEVEIFLGVFIGAITFTGSVIAFGKLRDHRFAVARLGIPERGESRCRSDAAAYNDGHCFPHRRSSGDGDWRCRYAGGGVHAEQLFRLGRSGDGLHAVQ